MASKNPLRGQCEAYLLAEIARVGLEKFDTFAAANHLMALGVKRTAAYRWIGDAKKSAPAPVDPSEPSPQSPEDLEASPSLPTTDAKPEKVTRDPLIDVKAIRLRTRLSQFEFAARFGFSPSGVAQWERKARIADRGAAMMLLLIDHDPSLAASLAAKLAALEEKARVEGAWSRRRLPDFAD